ncbi:hypothetical protein IPL68_06285 [Candidatus Saccharibacteria bacterium]|nr:MAG: hypothetical protein IPL68_06285 [Candidatus Saccharibacteria bacterium]
MTKKRRGLVVFAVVLVVFVAIAWWQGWVRPVDSRKFMQWQPGSYAVKQFVDGDTVMVDMQGTTETIRFIGIDTP